MTQSALVNGAGLKSPALGLALGLGVLGDALLQSPGRPALNLVLWALAGIAVLAWLQRRRGGLVTGEAAWLVLAALGFVLTLVWRDAAAPVLFSVLAAIILLTLAAGLAMRPWITRAHPGQVFFSAARVAVLCLTGPLGWNRSTADQGAEEAGWTAHARTLVRGTIIAVPALIVLTALLMSADPVFAGLVESLFRFDMKSFIEHAVFAAVLAWFSAGYLRAALVPDDGFMNGLRVPRPSLAAGEVTVALCLLNALFIVFMAVQVRYLFGGSGLVEVTPGLGYADYARRGFFELVACAALVVPILMLADWGAMPHAARARRLLRGASLLLVVLLMGVLASAAYRMWLYQAVYGLTELRLYVNVFLCGLAVILVWLVATVLRDRHERFIPGVIVVGLLCIAALQVLYPHALIARVNLQRHAFGAVYDASYLRSLSADAVPVIVRRLDAMPALQRQRLTCALQLRWGGERSGGWRTWNLGDWRARRLVEGFPDTQGCSGLR